MGLPGFLSLHLFRLCNVFNHKIIIGDCGYSGSMLIHLEPGFLFVVTMRALKHVFALHETCVVAVSSIACCATVVAHVILKLYPFVLAQGPFAVQTARKRCVCFWWRITSKPVIKCFCFLTKWTPTQCAWWQDEGHVVTSDVVHLKEVCVIKGVLFDYNSVNHCS